MMVRLFLVTHFLSVLYLEIWNMNYISILVFSLDCNGGRPATLNIIFIQYQWSFLGICIGIRLKPPDNGRQQIKLCVIYFNKGMKFKISDLNVLMYIIPCKPSTTRAGYTGNEVLQKWMFIALQMEGKITIKCLQNSWSMRQSKTLS